MTGEQFKDEILSLFEEKEIELSKYEAEITKMEQDAMDLFNRRCSRVKDELIKDVSVSDENLEERYLQEIEAMRTKTFNELKNELDVYVKNMEKLSNVVV